MERVLWNRVSVLQSDKMFSLFWSAYEWREEFAKSKQTKEKKKRQEIGQSCLLPMYTHTLTHTQKRTHTQDLPGAVSDLHIIIIASDSPSFSWPLFFTSSLKCNGGLIRSIHGRHRDSLTADEAVETPWVHVNQATKWLSDDGLFVLLVTLKM